MTTNLERSKPIWRSSSGRTPRPIEPKPSITIGPANSACIMCPSVVRASAFISIAPRKASVRRVSGGTRRNGVGVDKAGHEGGKVRLGLTLSARADQPARAVQRAGMELDSEQTVPLVRAGHPQAAGLLRRMAKARVIRRVSDQ